MTRRHFLANTSDARLAVKMITAVLVSHVRKGERGMFPLSIAGNPLSDWQDDGSRN